MMNKLIVGVSGGPDSMALLHKLIEQGCKVVVAHVNYQVREKADEDEKVVVAFCGKYQLPLERLYPGPISKGNFQKWARDKRYQFFAQLVDKYHFDGVAVAHHLNDLVETYWLQKQQQRVIDYYGIAKETTLYGVKVIRPLLDMSKEELLIYCKKQQIEYVIDESNVSLKYQRNNIRLQLTNFTKEQLLAEQLKSEVDNSQRYKLIMQAKDLSIDFTNQTSQLQIENIYQLLKQQGYYYKTTKHVAEIVRQLLIKKYYQLAHGSLYLVDNRLSYQLASEDGFCYEFDKLKYGDYEQFKLKADYLDKYSFVVKAEDFPIKIRNWRNGDVILMKYGHKKVSRFFVDAKINHLLRRQWPVVLNQHQEIIFVPGLGCNSQHFIHNSNLTVVK